MKTRLFPMLDPRQNRLPADTSRIIRKPRMRKIPFVNPDLFVQNHPGISRNIAKFDPVNPAQIRRDMQIRLQRAVEETNRYVANNVHYKGIRFTVDMDTGRFVATVRDAKSGQMIKQIPSEQMLEMAARLKKNSGLLDLKI